MGSRKRNTKKSTLTHKESVRALDKMGQSSETMEINEDLPVPYRICKRILREGEAGDHLQTCKPQYLNGNALHKSKDKLISKKKPINNNYIENNETKNPAINIRSLRSNVDKSKETYNNYISVPKKKSIKNIASNIQLNSFVNRDSNDLMNNQKEGNGAPNMCKLATGKEKNVKPVRRGKRLTEEEIAERLRIISEKLKKKVEVKVCQEDVEEDERREIEDRLTALNKDSEISYLNDYPEFDDTGELETKNSVGGKLTNKSGLGHLNSSENSNGTIIITQRPDGQLHGCLSCTEVFISALELLRHKREKHTVPKIIMAPSEIKKFYDSTDRSHCPICKRVLVITTKSMYIKHLQTHTYVGEYECSICKKKFKRQDHMRMHKKRHITQTYI